jgi:hypothetical protein
VQSHPFLAKSNPKQGGIMERKREHQLQIIWEYIPSRISIPAETKKRWVSLLGDLLSAYWQGCNGNNCDRQKGDEHDRKNIN